MKLIDVVVGTLFLVLIDRPLIFPGLRSIFGNNFTAVLVDTVVVAAIWFSYLGIKKICVEALCQKGNRSEI